MKDFNISINNEVLEDVSMIQDPLAAIEKYKRHPSIFFFFIGIHSMQGGTATARHGVTRKEAQKRLQGTENLFRKNLQLKDVC